ncbi:MAG: hypothetical protein GY874_12120 [Desulfobacteraceae bacterium]|nr:hypothetical protein [Desulfobacteraceae bacterium]
MEKRITKKQLAHFGRAFTLLINRAMMYQLNHSMVQDSIKDVLSTGELILERLSPLVFILSHDKFYVEEEQLDPRLNTKRIAALFKNIGIQSVSFEKGLTKGELNIFTSLFTSGGDTQDVEQIKQIFVSKGVYCLKINHVTFKKITEDDQIVSRKALKNITPQLEDDDFQSRQKFMDALIESVLAEEYAQTLDIASMVNNPEAFSKKLIEADLKGAEKILNNQYDQSSKPITDAKNSKAVTGGNVSGKLAQTSPGIFSGVAGNVPGSVSGAFTGDTQADTPGDTQGGAPGMASNAADVDIEPGGIYAKSIPGEQISGPGVSVSAQPEMAAAQAPPKATAEEKTGPGLAETVKSQSTQRDSNAQSKQVHGRVLLHHLELMHYELKQQIEGKSNIDLSELAEAIFEMKKQLMEGIQTQKALGIAYANEVEIINNANALSDKVVLEIIRTEYLNDRLKIQRLAMIITRLIPEAGELRRLLAQIKKMLLEEGMPLPEYMKLIQELKFELQNEELVRILQESSETIGLDGDRLIEQLKQKPTQAAELIYLAAEANRGAGDENALADIMIEYIEDLGKKIAQEPDGPDGLAEKENLKKAMTEIESGLVKKLSGLNIQSDVLKRMENRINSRLDVVLDKMRTEWLNAQSKVEDTQAPKRLTILQTLEQNINNEEQMDDILKQLRKKADAGDIEENDFSTIYAEINKQKKLLEKADGQLKHAEILSKDELLHIIEKEIARVIRYKSCFSAIALSFVTAKSTTKLIEDEIRIEIVQAFALQKLVNILRDTDYIGNINKKKLLIILPMIRLDEARLALGRLVHNLHSAPVLVHNIPVNIRAAGIAEEFDLELTPDAQAFTKHISNKLMEMVVRVKNIQVLF